MGDAIGGNVFYQAYQQPVDYWLTPYDAVIDPMARNSKRGTLKNDIDSTSTTNHHMDACDLLLLARREGLMFGGGLFDPP